MKFHVYFPLEYTPDLYCTMQSQIILVKQTTRWCHSCWTMVSNIIVVCAPIYFRTIYH